MPALVSVVVINHNYAHFLGEAIQSALDQHHPHTEVVVVDDGSTDGSGDVIRSFGDRVRPAYQKCRGQVGAAALGLARSRGEVVIFLDADDILLPTATSVAARIAGNAPASMIHWPVETMEADGRRTGELFEPKDLPTGDLLPSLLGDGPGAIAFSPTSGNAWTRPMLERVLPPRADRHHRFVDTYLCALAPLYGPIEVDPTPHTLYRRHPGSMTAVGGFYSRLRSYRSEMELSFRAVQDHCRALNLSSDLRRWRESSYVHRLSRAVDELELVLSGPSRFVLIDGNEWDLEAVGGRQAVPFPERDGHWWGLPADEGTAVCELDRLVATGISQVVVAWPAFWWLEHYRSLAGRLHSCFRLILENDRLLVFEAV